MRGEWGLLPKVGALGLIFAATVGAVGDIRCHDSFNRLVVNSAMDARADQYVGLVRQTKRVFKKHQSDPASLREISDKWIKAAQKGEIMQIYPGYYGDSLVEGSKSDIFITCCTLANRVSELGDKELKVGNPEGRMDAIRSLELLNIVRFGSFETILTSASYARRPVRTLEAHAKELTAEEKRRLAAAQDPSIRRWKTNELLQVLRSQKIQYVARYGEQMAKEDDNSYIALLSGKGKAKAALHFYGYNEKVPLTSSKSK
jgi:hypothetical protein